MAAGAIVDLEANVKAVFFQTRGQELAMDFSYILNALELTCRRIQQDAAREPCERAATAERRAGSTPPLKVKKEKDTA